MPLISALKKQGQADHNEFKVITYCHKHRKEERKKEEKLRKNDSSRVFAPFKILWPVYSILKIKQYQLLEKN